MCRAPKGLVDGRGGWVLLSCLAVPPNFGHDAPGRIRGQAIAQNHQGPPGKRALALLPQAGSLYRQYLGTKDLKYFDYPARAGSESSGPVAIGLCVIVDHVAVYRVQDLDLPGIFQRQQLRVFS